MTDKKIMAFIGSAIGALLFFLWFWLIIIFISSINKSESMNVIFSKPIFNWLEVGPLFIFIMLGRYFFYSRETDVIERKKDIKSMYIWAIGFCIWSIVNIIASFMNIIISIQANFIVSIFLAFIGSYIASKNVISKTPSIL